MQRKTKTWDLDARYFLFLCPFSVQFSSVTESCLTLCDPMNRSLPVHHQLLEFTQTHVHRVGDAIQSSPLSSPSPPAFILAQHQGLFQGVSSSHQVAKAGVSASASVLAMNIQGSFPSGLTGLISLQSPYVVVKLIFIFLQNCQQNFYSPLTLYH